MRSALLYDAAMILSGQADKPAHVVIGAWIAVAWIGMDVLQFVDWVQAHVFVASTEFPFPI
jgi:hypothetical protein